MSAYHDLLSKENITQSSYSPGIVQNTERLARVLLSPKHYKNGSIVATAFEQILHPEGFSVLRHDANFDSSLQRTVQILETDDNKYIGYVSANVQDIRILTINSIYRVFVVLDTACSDRLSHADILTTRETIVSETLRKKSILNFIRYQISELFNDLNIIN